jgi:hypothetical protein
VLNHCVACKLLKSAAHVQLRASNNEYFTAPEFFAASLINKFEDAHAEWKFATYPTEVELIDDSSSVRMYLVPLAAGTYDLTSGKVAAANLNGAKIRIVAAEADLTPEAQVSAIDLNRAACGGAPGVADVKSSNSTGSTTEAVAVTSGAAGAIAALAWAPALAAAVLGALVLA